MRRSLSRAARAAFLALGVALGMVFAGAAGAAWVAEGLEIGLHEKPSLDSAITALVPSGTELEIIERDGPLARVRDGGGAEGWVDARYLADSPPAITLLEAARDALDAAESELGVAEKRITSLDERSTELEGRLDALTERNAAIDADRESLREELAAMRARADAAEERLSGVDRERSRLQAELDSVAAAPGPSTGLSQTLRDLQRLAEENQVLKQELAVLEANQEMMVTAESDDAPRPREPEPEPVAAAMAVAQPAGPAAATSTPARTVSAQPNLLGFLDWQAWQWMLLLSALLLAFGAGGYLVDFRIRRRHGGFRI